MKSNLSFKTRFTEFYVYYCGIRVFHLTLTYLGILFLWSCLDPIRPPQSSELDLTDPYSTLIDESITQPEDQLERSPLKPADQFMDLDQNLPLSSVSPTEDQGQSNSQDSEVPSIDQMFYIDQTIDSLPNDLDPPQDENVSLDQSSPIDQDPPIDSLDQNRVDPNTFPEAELSFDDETCYPLTDANHWTWVKHPTSSPNTVMVNNEFLQFMQEGDGEIGHVYVLNYRLPSAYQVNLEYKVESSDILSNRGYGFNFMIRKRHPTTYISNQNTFPLQTHRLLLNEYTGWLDDESGYGLRVDLNESQELTLFEPPSESTSSSPPVEIGNRIDLDPGFNQKW